jgi:outer membrane protein assembly factor BamB
MMRKVLFGIFSLLLAGGGCIFAFLRLGLMTYELTGGSVIPRLRWGSPEDHYRRIEEARAREAAPAPPPVETAAAKPPESAPAVKAPAAPAAAPYWLDFRGPRRDGVYDETPILTAWPAQGLQELWRTPVGESYGSVTVAEGRAYTIEQRRNDEVLAAYDMATGRELWKNAWPGRFSEAMGGDGPRSTPVWHEGRVYALGAAGELRAVEAASGRTLWRTNILTDAGATNAQWGMAASPLVVDGLLITTPGGPSGKSVIAYDKATGRIVWTAESDPAGYASPIVATLGGTRQIVITAGKRVFGLTLDGKLLWDFPWVTEYDVNAAEPVVVSGNRFVITSGYDHGAALVEVGPSGAKQIWFSKALKGKFNAPVLYQGHLYGLDEGILACVDAGTGERKWKGGRYGYGQVLLASGHLVIATEDGRVVLVKATPESHQEVASFAALDGKTWNYPALAGGKLLVRNQRELACYRIAP